MVEALGLAASVIAVLQLTSFVISICYDYGSAAKGTNWELSDINKELEGLRNVLQQLEPLAKQSELAHAARDAKLQVIGLLREPLRGCFKIIKNLEDKLATPSWCDGFGPRRRAFIQALRWPRKEAETKKVLENISRFKDTLGLALAADQATMILAIEHLSLVTNDLVTKSNQDLESIMRLTDTLHRDVEITRDAAVSVNREFQRVEMDNEVKSVLQWLSAPDPSTNYDRARRSRKAGTSSWLIESEIYRRWKGEGSMVWLYGKPGCGKTVLSSIIVGDIHAECQSTTNSALAYFYFYFNDARKQLSENMVRSLIAQFLEAGPSNELKSLYSDCCKGKQRPNDESLMKILRLQIASFKSAWIVIDALDECQDVMQLLSLIEEIQSWQTSQLHIILTSRWLKDIEDQLESLTDPEHRMKLSSASLNKDISTYVDERLQNDPKLKKWRDYPNVQREIHSRLLKKADGMFRWVVCQLDALQKCLNLSPLRKTLGSLPKTLDETYERILLNIPDEYSDYAIRILHWLTHSLRPLSLDELSEIVAVNLQGEPWFDPDAVFPEQDDLLAVCSNLVTLESPGDREVESPVVRLAHFSVQEYLISERMKHLPARKYAVTYLAANETIAATCVAYLLQFDEQEISSPDLLEARPIVKYAAIFWTQHARIIDRELGSVRSLGLRLLRADSKAYANWVRIIGYSILGPQRVGMFSWRAMKPICRYCKLSSEDNDRISMQPLFAITGFEVIELVRALLELGAEVDAFSDYGVPLLEASRLGNEDLTQLLLDYGADIDLKSGGKEYPRTTALQVASENGHEDIVRCLLQRGANINLGGDNTGHSPLAQATIHGQTAVAMLLLERGADVNLRRENDTCCTALQATIAEGLHKDNLSTARLLLQHGADVKIPGGRTGNALQAACSRTIHPVSNWAPNWFNRKALVVQLLLDYGADVHAQGGEYGNALQAAAYTGNTSVVDLLLRHGADVHAHGGFFGSALQAAAFHPNARRSEHMVWRLLKSGVDVNAVGGYYGSALQSASACGMGRDCNIKSKRVVRLLLDRGANVNFRGGLYGTALQAAQLAGKPGVVQLLLDRGAAIDENGGTSNNALQVAV